MRPSILSGFPQSSIIPTSMGTLLMGSTALGGIGGRGPCYRFQPAGMLTSTGGGGGGGTVDPFAANVWTEWNRITDDGKTKTVSLTGLPEGARELVGEYVKIDGLTSLNGNFFHDPPWATSVVDAKGIRHNVLTKDSFDQVVTYHTLTSLIHYITGLGFDPKKTISQLTKLPFAVHVNGTDALNAWFNPSKMDLTFGTGKGLWHLASDGEIVLHEMGHFIFHCINSALASWYSGDGGAIHEGFGDGIACLFTNDPQASEDFPPNVGKAHGTDRGLRTVDNKLQYGKVKREVHSLGRVYGAFWWALRTALIPLLGNDERAAADLAAAFLINHGVHYATNKPGPGDFLDASIIGSKAYLEGAGRSDIAPAKVKELMTAAAMERGMVGEKLVTRGNRLPYSDDVARLFTDLSDQFVFIPDPSTLGTFGGRVFIQQFQRPGTNEAVRMLGSGIIVFKDNEGRSQSWSNADLRLDVKVDPTMNLNVQAALERAVAAIKQRIGKAESEMDELSRKEYKTDRAERKRLVDIARLESRISMANLALEAEQKMQIRAERVIMPEGYKKPQPEVEHYHWRLDFDGHGELLVDAKTGEVHVAELPVL